MELKKSKKADLERSRGIFLQIGLVFALSVVFIAFEWTSRPDVSEPEKMVADVYFEVEEMQITRREEPRPEPIPQQQVIEILNIVKDDAAADGEFDSKVEANSETEVTFTGFADEGEEFKEEEVFLVVEDMPKFNGGDPVIEFRKFIFRNLRFPETAAAKGISGRVVIQFAINSQGKLVDAVIVESVDEALDKEAIRVVMSSPPWTPGKQRGKPVKVLYFFPINFMK